MSKAIQPTKVTTVDLSKDEVEVFVPAGWVLVQGLDDAGGDLDRPFTSSQGTWDKVYSKHKYPNGSPKFSIKKKQ